MDSRDFHNEGGQRWRYDASGVFLESASQKPLRTNGNPTTANAILAAYGTEIFSASMTRRKPGLRSCRASTSAMVPLPDGVAASCTIFGRVISPSVSDADAKTLFPSGWKTVRPYLRFVPQPKS